MKPTGCTVTRTLDPRIRHFRAMDCRAGQRLDWEIDIGIADYSPRRGRGGATLGVGITWAVL